MKCKVCNADLLEGQSFCSYCGSKIEEASENPTETKQETNQPIIVTKEDPYAKNAKTGLIFGILSVAISCIGMIFGIIGIVNSAKGLKSTTSKGMAIPGLILSIVGIISSIFTIIYVIAFAYGMMLGFMDADIPTYALNILNTLSQIL